MSECPLDFIFDNRVINMVRLKAAGEKFDIKSKMVDSGVKFPNTDPGDMTRHNKFKVIVCKVKNSDRKVCKTFDYYGSQADWEKGIDKMSEEDLKYAFKNIVDDAIYGMMSFDEFVGELGYDSDSRRAEKIWKETRKSYDKLSDMSVSEDDLYDIVNELSERGIE